MSDGTVIAMKTVRAKRERNTRMRMNRKAKIALGACLTLWSLAIMAPSPSLAAPDADADGVANRKDLCTPTPSADYFACGVDADGCSDCDSDGVFGYVDLCPGTLAGTTVDSNGCPTDIDGDGYGAPEDCNDNDPAVNPGAAEVCGDGIDNNCDGTADGGCGGGPADTDGDGFSDIEEQGGIILPAGMTLADGSTTFLPACTGGERALCVDMSSPDVFVIVDRADGCPASNSCGLPCSALFNTDGDAENDSNIPLPASYPAAYAPFNPLSRIDAAGSGGLGVTTHEVLQPSGGSQAIAGHFAVRIIEDLDPCTGSLLGLSTPGVPREGIQATVFTGSIIRWIGDTCTEACFTDRHGVTTCYDPTADPPDPSIDTFLCDDAISGISVDVLAGESLDTIYFLLIPNIIVHEFGHLIDLATGNEASAFHLPAATGYFMEQSLEVKGSNKRGDITQTIYISEDFHPDSVGGFRLK